MAGGKLHACAEALFRRLGGRVGAAPWRYAALGLLALLSGVPGLWLLEGDQTVLGLPLDTNFLRQFALRGKYIWQI